ncbi:hypothetical protein C9374_000484 [Naegleria lovaniensis]|uniref:N-acetyltransferase domain-containing protein n=1 Tax=Naegleria lovaniensis TaxID=51637 RepID=A0AA88GWL4_NAELO|nr:uncharacterized protein C9374_000484 [Naegleria lovaniensis]KAG2388320.1 hypothetical protein C9374_000484 [Naegleria lovaniensis]
MSEAYFSEHLQIGENQFSCVVGDGNLQSSSKAILEFDKKKVHVHGQTMGEDEFGKKFSFVVHEFYHIEIPDSCRGKGVAMPFAKACFDYAKQHGWKVKVTCPYLREKFLGQYREKYRDILYGE